MLLIEENHAGASTSTHADSKMLYTEDEASGHAMEAADVIREEGTEVMPTATPDPPETGGVEAMRTDKGRPSRSAGIVARKATRRASAGRTSN